MATRTILSLWNVFVTVQLLMPGDPECSARGYNNNNIPSFCCSVSSSALFARTASSRTREVAAGRLGTVSANFSMYWNAPLKHDKLTMWQQADWEQSQQTFPCTETLLWNMTNWQRGSRQTGNCLSKLFYVLKRSSETWQIDNNMAAGRLGTVSANFFMYWNAPLKHDKLTTTWQQADWEQSLQTFPCTEMLLWNMTNWQHGSRQTGHCLCKLFHVLKRSSETWQIDNNMAAGRLGTISANFSMYWNAPLKHDKLTTWQQADWALSLQTFPCTETLLWNMTNWQHGSRQTGHCLCKLFHVLKRSSETWQIDNMAAGRLGTVSANFSMSQNTPLKHDRTDNNVPAFFPCISSNTCHSSRQKRTTTGESETA